MIILRSQFASIHSTLVVSLATAMSPISKMKNNKFCTSSALFFTTCTNTTVNFLVRLCLEDLNTTSPLSPNLGAVPKTP